MAEYVNAVHNGLNLGGTTAEDVAEIEREEAKFREENLIPAGTYEGQLQEWAAQPVKSDKSPFFGENIAHCTVELYDVGPEMRTRKHFFNASGIKKLNAGGKIASEYRVLHAMAQATGTVGKPAEDTLEAAKAVRLKYKITTSAASGQFKARNWTETITAL